MRGEGTERDLMWNDWALNGMGQDDWCDYFTTFVCFDLRLVVRLFKIYCVRMLLVELFYVLPVIQACRVLLVIVLNLRSVF